MVRQHTKEELLRVALRLVVPRVSAGASWLPRLFVADAASLLDACADESDRRKAEAAKEAVK